MTVRSPTFRVREGAVGEVARLAVPREPGASRLLGALGELAPRHRRLWVAEGDDGVAGALVVARIATDVWTSVPLLVDRRAAAALASVVDASRACSLEGPRADVEPFVEHLARRPHPPVHLPLVRMDAFVARVRPDDVDPRTRTATAADVDRLVDLYARYELTAIRTVPRLRRFLVDRVARGWMGVLEEGGRLRAAAYAITRTDRFVVLSGLTVAPEGRGRGLGAALLPYAALRARREGLGMVAVWAPTNGIRLKPSRLARWCGEHPLEPWMQVWLGEPRGRFRGERRLRRLVVRLQRPVVSREAARIRNQAPTFRPDVPAGAVAAP